MFCPSTRPPSVWASSPGEHWGGGEIAGWEEGESLLEEGESLWAVSKAGLGDPGDGREVTIHVSICATVSSVCLSIHLPVCMYSSVQPYTSVSVHLSTHLSVCICLCLTIVYPSVRPYLSLIIYSSASLCLSLYTSFYVYLYPSICPSICPSVCPSV